MAQYTDNPDFYYKIQQNKVGVSYVRESEEWEFDLHRFIQTSGGGPYYVKAVPALGRKYRKKILLSIDLDHITQPMIEELLMDGFEVSYLDKDNHFVDIKDMKDVPKEFQILNQRLAEEKLIAVGKNSKQYFIIDEYEKQRFEALKSKNDHWLYSSTMIDDKTISNLKEKYRIEKIQSISLSEKLSGENDAIFFPSLVKLKLNNMALDSIKCPAHLQELHLLQFPSNEFSGHFPELKTFIIEFKKINTTFKKIGPLPKKLKKLTLLKCFGIKSLDVGELEDLEELSILYCYDIVIEKFPKNIKKLTLDMHKIPFDAIPTTVHSLSLNFNDVGIESLDFSKFNYLTALEIFDLKNLKTIKSLPPNIKSLKIHYCGQLITIPNLDSYASLDKSNITIIGCEKLEEQPLFFKDAPGKPRQSEEWEEKSKAEEIKTEKKAEIKAEIKETVAPVSSDSAIPSSTETSSAGRPIYNGKMFKADRYINGDDKELYYAPNLGVEASPSTVLFYDYAIYKGNLLIRQPPTLYRHYVLKNIEYHNGNIGFKSPKHHWKEVPIKYPLNLQSPNLKKEFSSDHFLVEYPLKECEDFIIVPTLSANDIIESVPDGARLFQDEETKEYAIKIPANLKNKTLYYIGKTTPIKSLVREEKISGHYDESMLPKLPEELIEQLEKIIVNDPKFNLGSQIKLAKQASYEDKIKFCYVLQKFFYAFSSYDLRSENDENLDILLRAIKQKRGNCSHRAAAFVLICQYIGVPAQWAKNHLHCYAEILLNDRWQPIQVGGVQAKLVDLFKETANLFTKQASIFSHWLKEFCPDLAVPREISKTDDMVAWISQQSNILLKLSSLQEARDTYAAIAEQAKKENKPVFYLESVQDIQHFMKLKGLVPETGQFSETRGPLADFLESKEGILVVNWSRFEPHEMAVYKSIMDEEPTLLHKKISKGIQVLNLTTHDHQGCEAIQSRAAHIEWPFHIAPPPPVLNFDVQTIDLDDLPKDINPVFMFDNNLSWRQKLFSEFDFTDKGITIIPQALASGTKVLDLVDAPLEDEDFQGLLFRLMVHREYIDNGQIKKLPEDFKIRFFKTIDPTVLPKALKPMSLAEYQSTKTEDDDIYCLSAGKTAKLYKQKLIKKNKLVTTDGWLDAKIKRKVLFKTGPLTDGQEKELYYHLKKYPDGEIIWVDLSEQKQGLAPDLKAYSSKHFKSPGAQLIITHDPHFVAELFKPSSDVCELIHLRTNGANVIEHSEVKGITSGGISCSQQIQEITNALIDGKTVLLHGLLSEDLYQALEPLFSPNPHLRLSHTEAPVPVKGKLILVTKPLSFSHTLASATQRKFHVNEKNLWATYENKLSKHPAYQKQGQSLRKLFEYIQDRIPHGRVGAPAEVYITFERLWHLLNLLDQSKRPDDNLIKSLILYDYEKGSETYAEINVQIKKLLGLADEKPGVRSYKLKKYPTTPDFFWRRLNCLNATAIQSLEKLDNEHLDKFLSNPPFNEIKKNEDSQAKIQRRILAHLKTGNSVVLKGPPGLGKTYTATTCFKAGLYIGEQQIISFLESKPNQGNLSILLIDEANLAAQGTWDFLMPHVLARHGKSIVKFKGKDYSLDENFKIIFTCNPESYPGRDYHSILQESPTVYVPLLTDETLKNKILLKLCPGTLTEERGIALDSLLKAFHLAERLLPPHSLSVRDAQQVVRRWLFLMDQGLTDQQAAYEAALYEWQNRFYQKNDREFFKKELRVHFNDIDPTTIIISRPLNFADRLPKDFYLSEKQRLLMAQLQQDILLAKKAQDDKTVDHASTVKAGFLIEGPSGIGKSSLSRALLIAMEYTEINENDLLDSQDTDLSNRFIHFTLSGNLAYDEKLIRKAFNSGCKVILDELNLDPMIEGLLNHLLTGKTPEGTPPQFKGFYLLASQNSGSLEGRSTSPPALLNRLHIYYLDDYDLNDLLEIAKQALDMPEHIIAKIINAYLYQKNCFPMQINSRNFLKKLKKIAAQSFIDQNNEFTPLLIDCIKSDEIEYFKKRIDSMEEKEVIRLLRLKNKNNDTILHLAASEGACGILNYVLEKAKKMGLNDKAFDEENNEALNLALIMCAKNHNYSKMAVILNQFSSHLPLNVINAGLNESVESVLMEHMIHYITKNDFEKIKQIATFPLSGSFIEKIRENTTVTNHLISLIRKKELDQLHRFKEVFNAYFYEKQYPSELDEVKEFYNQSFDNEYEYLSSTISKIIKQTMVQHFMHAGRIMAGLISFNQYHISYDSKYLEYILKLPPYSQRIARAIVGLSNKDKFDDSFFEQLKEYLPYPRAQSILINLINNGLDTKSNLYILSNFKTFIEKQEINFHIYNQESFYACIKTVINAANIKPSERVASRLLTSKKRKRAVSLPDKKTNFLVPETNHDNDWVKLFKILHEDELSSCCTRTRLKDYQQETILKHANERTFFGFRNRTYRILRENLKDYNIIDEKGEPQQRIMLNSLLSVGLLKP